MEQVGHYLKAARESLDMPLHYVNQQTRIDLTLLSRIENGKRTPTREQVLTLARLYSCDQQALIIHWLSDKFVQELHNEKDALEVLKVAGEKVRYGRSLSLFPDLSGDSCVKLESRRYIGNKAKLTNWIMGILAEHASDATSFFDPFSGTASVAKQAMMRYDKVIVNDLLYSNHIVYKGFFDNAVWRKDVVQELIDYYNSLNACEVEDNYFSEWFGGKFFDYDNAKLIGFIREDIEQKRVSLTNKEFSILLCSLIYAIDKIANTVGHFDAYIKKPIKRVRFTMKLIEQINNSQVDIYREDANVLASKIKADIVYIDPPYNSRQYSRFYHIYENLVTWRKPTLHGVALKPEAENMSAYCTVKARDAFESLIGSINAKYIAVSYNNTYTSQSSSSKNKISLSQIEEIMRQRGETEIFECSHKFFNTGKTDFKDHKELLFLTKVTNEGRATTLPFPDVLCRG